MVSRYHNADSSNILSIIPTGLFRTASHLELTNYAILLCNNSEQTVHRMFFSTASRFLKFGFHPEVVGLRKKSLLFFSIKFDSLSILLIFLIK